MIDVAPNVPVAPALVVVAGAVCRRRHRAHGGGADRSPSLVRHAHGRAGRVTILRRTILRRAGWAAVGCPTARCVVRPVEPGGGARAGRGEPAVGTAVPVPAAVAPGDAEHPAV